MPTQLQLHSLFEFLFIFLFKIPEDMENFTITLLNATGGARMGNILSANLQINKNDDPIYFSGKNFTIYEGSSERLVIYSYIITTATHSSSLSPAIFLALS